MCSSQWTVKQHVVLREGWKKTFSKGLSVVRGIKTEYKDRKKRSLVVHLDMVDCVFI